MTKLNFNESQRAYTTLWKFLVKPQKALNIYRKFYEELWKDSEA